MDYERMQVDEGQSDDGCQHGIPNTQQTERQQAWSENATVSAAQFTTDACVCVPHRSACVNSSSSIWRSWKGPIGMQRLAAI
eukprot:1157543-Pelagomonas_calceolata.AAC.1